MGVGVRVHHHQLITSKGTTRTTAYAPTATSAARNRRPTSCSSRAERETLSTSGNTGGADNGSSAWYAVEPGSDAGAPSRGGTGESCPGRTIAPDLPTAEPPSRLAASTDLCARPVRWQRRRPHPSTAGPHRRAALPRPAAHPTDQAPRAHSTSCRSTAAVPSPTRYVLQVQPCQGRALHLQRFQRLQERGGGWTGVRGCTDLNASEEIEFGGPRSGRTEVQHDTWQLVSLSV